MFSFLSFVFREIPSSTESRTQNRRCPKRGRHQNERRRGSGAAGGRRASRSRECAGPSSGGGVVVVFQRRRRRRGVEAGEDGADGAGAAVAEDDGGALGDVFWEEEKLESADGALAGDEVFVERVDVEDLGGLPDGVGVDDGLVVAAEAPAPRGAEHEEVGREEGGCSGRRPRGRHEDHAGGAASFGEGFLRRHAAKEIGATGPPDGLDATTVVSQRKGRALADTTNRGRLVVGREANGAHSDAAPKTWRSERTEQRHVARAQRPSMHRPRHDRPRPPRPVRVVDPHQHLFFFFFGGGGVF
mmetsp:Transcript_24221/g.74728  ORF Transcript_24221/g.74728 Transcript_24221/m.74728 type:complete len:301 (+) Transcript_24221:181-1083(+)